MFKRNASLPLKAYLHKRKGHVNFICDMSLLCLILPVKSLLTICLFKMSQCSVFIITEQQKHTKNENNVDYFVFLFVSSSPRSFLVNIREGYQILETKSSSKPTTASYHRKPTPASRVVSQMSSSSLEETWTFDTTPSRGS